jgi:hypothetical protein
MLFGFEGDQPITGGSITVTMDWHHYGDHQVALLRRSQGGSIAAIIKWRHCVDHGMAL